MTPVQVCSICGGPIVGTRGRSTTAYVAIGARVVLPALLERTRVAEHKHQGNDGDV